MANIHSSITFGLVNIPIILNPIIKNNDTSFNQLHKKCMHRINYIKYCPYCKKDIKENEIIKGYEYKDDEYLTFTPEELSKLKIENNKEIEVIAFVNLDSIDSYYFEKSYYLKTEKKTKAYLLFCEALKVTKKVALAKTIIGSKFYYCILKFHPYGIIMTTLYFAEEIRLPDEKVSIEVNQKELDLAIKLIKSMSEKFKPENYRDEYQNDVKEAIEDKLSGKKIKKVGRKTSKQVTELMEALEKSLKGKS